MVDFFFILSGFVITHNYKGKINNFREGFNFMVLRFFRLYPLHFVTLIFFVFAIGGVHLFLNHPIQSFISDYWFSFFCNIFLVHSLGLLPDNLFFNTPSWSISVEFYAYLIFGLVTIFGKRTIIINFLLLALSLSLLLVYSPSLNESVNTFGFLRCLLGFNIGCLLYSLPFEKFKINYSIFFIILIFFLFFIFKSPYTYFDYLVYIPCALIIIGSIVSRNKIYNKIIKHPALVITGTYSYSVYMVHEPIMYSIKLVLAYFKTPLALRGNAYIYDVGNLNSIILILVYLFLIFLASYLSFKFIEEPFRLRGRKYVKNLNSVK